MKTALRISLFLAITVGLAWPGLGQGSMSRYTAAARPSVWGGKSLTTPSTHGFTISAQRDSDRSVAITVSSATRFWFLDASAPRQSLVAAGRYQNAALWAQASQTIPTLAFAGNNQSFNPQSSLKNSRNLGYNPDNSASRVDAGLSQYDEKQLDTWIQRNIRFANVDLVPK
jgi:hypothetical protein